jgi:hypothetical protein
MQNQRAQLSQSDCLDHADDYTSWRSGTRGYLRTAGTVPD